MQTAANHSMPVGANAKHVLLIAYHFPPDAASTGRLRTLAFARHLPALGWNATVLAPSPMAYERTDREGLADVPDTLRVVRTPALDARKHLGWRGRYAAATAVPDRWVSWWPTAVAAGLALIRRHEIDAIWSTYPIATTHLIGATLSRVTGVPWIADFRDPVVPAGTRLQRAAVRYIERQTLDRATAAVFTTPGARRRYAERFPRLERERRLHVVPNGYEESGVTRQPAPYLPDQGQAIRLVHSGLLYTEGRNPEPFFRALADLKQTSRISAATLQITLRASGSESVYQAYLDRLDVADIVHLAPPVSYREALAEQAAAHGLLLFQGPQFNAQIPAKVFEYLRIGRPVFALTDPAGDTAQLLEETGGSRIATIDQAHEIAGSLWDFIEQIRQGQAPAVDDSALARYTRRACTEKLATLMDSLLEHR